MITPQSLFPDVRRRRCDGGPWPVKALRASLGIGRVVHDGSDHGIIFDRKRTIKEDDDDVELRPFKSASLIDLSFAQVEFYGLAIVSREGADPEHIEHQLMFSSLQGIGGVVAFDDLTEALQLRSWLRSQLERGNSNALGAGQLNWPDAKVKLWSPGPVRDFPAKPGFAFVHSGRPEAIRVPAVPACVSFCRTRWSNLTPTRAKRASDAGVSPVLCERSRDRS